MVANLYAFSDEALQGDAIPNNLIQWKPLNRANRLFEQFRLKKKIYLFPLINSSLIRAVRRVAAPWLARS